MAGFADDLKRIPMASELAQTLSRAADYAQAQSHDQIQLEHLLLSLTQDPDAMGVLSASHVDIGLLNADISQYLGGLTERISHEGSAPMVAPDLKRILEAAAAAAAQGRRRDINGAIVLAAIVGDGRSPAAHMLRAQGLTFEEAIKALQRAMVAPAAAPKISMDTEDLLAKARSRVHQTRSVPLEAPAVAAPPPQPVPTMPQVAAAEAGERMSEWPPEVRPASYVDPAAQFDTPAPSSPPAPQIPSNEDREAAFRGDIQADGGLSLELPNLPQSVYDSYAAPPAQPYEQGFSYAANVETAYGTAPPYGSESGYGADPHAGRADDRRSEPLPPSPDPMFAPPSMYSEAEGVPPRPSMPEPTPPPLNFSPLSTRDGPPAPAPAPGPARSRGAPPQAKSRWPAPVAPAWREDPAAGPPPLPDLTAPNFEPGFDARTGSVGGPSGYTAAPFEPELDHLRGSPNLEHSSPEPSRVPRTPVSLSPRDDGAGVPTTRGRRRRKTGDATARAMADAIPKRMRVGYAVSIESQISKADIHAIVAGLGGGVGGSSLQALQTPAMSVRLRAPDAGFLVDALSSETQWFDHRSDVIESEFAHWRWTVTPLKTGRHQLQLVIAVRAAGPDGLVGDQMLPDAVVEVGVRRNWGRALGGLVKWLVVAGLGAAAALYGAPMANPLIDAGLKFLQ